MAWSGYAYTHGPAPGGSEVEEWIPPRTSPALGDGRGRMYGYNSPPSESDGGDIYPDFLAKTFVMRVRVG